MVRFGVPGQNVDTLAYADGRLSTVPAVQAPRRPTVNDKKYPLWCEWRVNKEAVAPVLEGEFWKLIRFESNGDATWVMLNAAQGGTLDDLRDQVNVQVTPDASGNIDIDGNAVNAGANPSGIPLETVADTVTNTLDLNLQVSAAITGAPGDKNNSGICSFDNIFFAVDANGWTTITDVLLQHPIGTTFNLGINYSSPTLTVTSSDGTALSATNPAFVVLPSKASPGYKIVVPIIADISFDDDSGTSDLTGNTWGTTSTVAWNVNMPFFMYAVADDAGANPTIMISRVPHIKSSPAAGNIAKSGSAVASTQGSFFAIDSTLTVASYDANPCAVVGSFRMLKNDAANDDWTVAALSNTDGFGRFQESTFFSLPADQNGAVSNNLSSSVGGDTLPTFNQVGRAYRISLDGMCLYTWNFDTCSVNGVGAGILRLHIPFTIGYDDTYYSPAGNSTFQNVAAANWSCFTSIVFDELQYFEFVPSGTGVAKLTPAGITTDKAQWAVTFDYIVNTG